MTAMLMDSEGNGVVVEPDCDLEVMAERINAEHVAYKTAESAFAGAIGHAISAGEMLLRVRSEIEHGDWYKWIEENLLFGRETARQYMKIAKSQARLRFEDGKSPESIRQALRILTDGDDSSVGSSDEDQDKRSPVESEMPKEWASLYEAMKQLKKRALKIYERWPKQDRQQIDALGHALRGLGDEILTTGELCE